MDKVFCMGWVYSLKTEVLKNGTVQTTFKLKTKKTVGMKDRDKAEYYYIPCHVRGKKAININEHIHEGDRICFWARIWLDDIGRLTLAVDELEFL